MTIAVFSFISIVLFMIHEFDEIIFVRAWLKTPNDNQTVADIWRRRSDKAYPSTAVISLMIAEEFILISVLLWFCILFNWREFALGIIIAHSLHLFGHIANTVNIKRWSPGAPTAAVTLPLIAIMIWFFADPARLSPMRVLLATVLAALIFFPNLILLYKFAPHLQNFIDRVYKK